MANETFSLVHTLEELNQIIAALADRPFKEVAGLIQKIHQAAQKQMPLQTAQELPQTRPVTDADLAKQANTANRPNT